ncbi:MAG: hypothetical protein ACI92S_002331, partial [Planctomycetaceae bacterium]
RRNIDFFDPASKDGGPGLAKGIPVFKAAKSQPGDDSRKDLPDYDDEITPFARGLKIPYLHVTRIIASKDLAIDRIV